MMQELKDKQEKSQVLLEEVSKLPRNINRYFLVLYICRQSLRTMYTYRIMDIIASIGKLPYLLTFLHPPQPNRTKTSTRSRPISVMFRKLLTCQPLHHDALSL